MSSSGWEEGELDFQLIFEEDQQHQADTTAPDSHLSAGHIIQSIGIVPSPPLSTNHRAGMHSPPPRRALVREFSGTYESLPARSVQVSESRVLECPSIQITTISPDDDFAPDGGHYWDRDRLYLPLLDPYCYRDSGTGAGSLSPSPASSPSSRGWLSPASSCESLLVEEEELSEAATHFCLSPSSRPTSPGGKKRRNSPLASPCHSRRSSYSEEQAQYLEAGDSAPQTQGHIELSIPQKTRKTSLEQVSSRDVELEQIPSPNAPCPPSDLGQIRRDPTAMGMDYLSVPNALGWGRTRASAHSPIFRSNALPPLDWPLPCQFDQFELRIDVQPRPHHRAHYETEGSRGAVKASPGGHPVVKLVGYTERQPLSLQVFVGTADDRSIRPHPFYQIHRVTGKMVGTASQESIQAGTKLLEIPLNPETNMTALIDCAGILKLRNSDIELRKGETDVGRKNTRVRLVFRTHLPLAPPLGPPGRVLALQVASQPIECSQRSAQELPVIESISLTSCSVEGGAELLINGSNFLPTSRALFMERGSDGKLQWEEEAHVDREKSTECTLCVRVPAYSDLCVNQPVCVCVYVSNGKRKRSSTHCFKYLPILFKEEDPLLPRPSLLPLDGVMPLCPPHPSDYHYPGGYHDEFCPPADEDQGGGNDCEPSFQNLELGFTELLPPLYPPQPWPDSPYLSSSPSPSHSSSISPFPSSPVSTSPLPPPLLAHCPPAYPQEGHLGYGGAPPMQHITLDEVNEFIGEDIRTFHTDSRSS
ncbi:nuclear factor of activated T-cells, cytoplasmic 4 [Trichomycterus rosablanca]|uniref:nuclear factor of activated T-cells, cytoplasmic 4 n=1 Tax=Trichomycterus rosablanca TaxID=2290929 RepID=UPI002F352061